MFRMTLGVKLGMGFGLILILTITVAGLGWYGLASITERFEKMNNVNQLVQGIYKTQLAEKDYRLTEQESHIKQVNEQVNTLVTQAQLTKEEFQQTVNKEQMDDIIKKVHEYEASFLNYVNLAKQKAIAMGTMQQSAEKVLQSARDNYDDQEQQLQDIRKQAETFLQEKITNVADATRLLQLADNLKRLQMTLIAQVDADKLAEWQNDYQQFIELAKSLQARFHRQENLNQINIVLSNYTQYQPVFQHYLAEQAQFAKHQDQDQETMIAALAKAIQEMQAIHTDQSAQLAAQLKVKVDDQAETKTIQPEQVKPLENRRQQSARFLQDTIAKVDDANQLIKLSLIAKTLHIALLQQEDAAKFAEWQKINQDIIDLARSLKTRFQQPADRDRIDALLISYGQYQQLFLNFLQNRRDVANQQQQRLASLTSTMTEAMKLMQAIHVDQSAQLTQRLQENSLLINDKLAKANDAEHLIEGILEARHDEKQFIISAGETQYAEQVNRKITDLLKLAQDLTHRFTLDKHIKQGKGVIVALEKYQAAFQSYVNLTAQQNQANQEMMQMAQEAQTTNEVTRQDQQHKMSQEIAVIHRYLIMGATIAVIIGILIAIIMTRRIVHPLTQVVALSHRLTVGDLAARVEIRQTQDEVGLLLNAMNNLAERFQKLIEAVNETLSQLAQGQMTARIQGEFPGEFAKIKQASNHMANDLQLIISETSQALAQLAAGDMQIQMRGQFLGDFSTIKTALETTADKLNTATTQNNIQNWLKTGQSQLSEQTSGEKDIVQLAEDIINFLTPYLEAQVGAFYIFKEDQAEPYLKMIASHAYVWRKNAVYEFKIGEGIIGQSALERKMFVTAQAPADYIFIQSGLGESPPRAILIAPFLYENRLKGAIELAAFTPFTKTQLDFLNQILPLIAIAINTAESRTQMQILLEQSQQQAEELRAQQEELQQTNEQLQGQAEELQAQAEELQAQQEELRQTNEMLQMRGQELERQQAAVQIKNTELEQATAVVQAKAEELELASKYKSEFLANMSHELRTPLNSMLILAQLLADNKNGNLSATQAEYARTIHSSGNDLLTLINDILDLSKVEAGKLEVNPEQLAFTDLTASLEQKFRPLAEKKGITFTVQIAENLPAAVYTDPQRLKQIITNLLANAFKFTQTGGVTLNIARPTSQIDLSRSQLKLQQTIAFNVIDTGIGIPKEKQKIIFEAFQQADGTTSRRYGGTGLGLSISRQLAQLLGGEIQLHSEEGQGSTFTAYLPEKWNISGQQPLESPPKLTFPSPANPATIPSPATPAVVELPLTTTTIPQDDRNRLQPGDKSLLIIEDDVNFSHILMGIAQEKQFKCLLAHDGYSGLQLAEQYRPSAIILDIGLPQIDGWTVMEKLKGKPETRHIPVQFVSGSDQSKEAKQLGAIGYCLKPVGMTELTKIFKNIDNFINKTVKNLLVITDDPQHQQNIVKLVQGEGIQLVMVSDRAKAQPQLQSEQFDCLILDVDVEHRRGTQLLEQLCHDSNLPHDIPVIIYAERELTALEAAILQQCAETLTIKEVHSPERLLDEVTLFLHQIESKLSQEQQQILHKVHDPQAILSGKKLLLVDDDMRNVFALAASLENKGMEVITAHNGQDALARLSEHPDIAVVLMDIMMPNMDGYEATRKIRAQPPFRKLPIIALTAKAMKGDKAKCIEAGANDYLAKPVNTEKLISLLRVWLYP
ncbi:signal transduction histidine kinase [Thioploca ingrica]|uniref:histidine kinase n=1 Tax=Thioploca ingrica TaxID=40754 RepID=A0A090BV52_9GAMM|nr:signal transduction histidine kinase [Thioploca ingrica]